MKGIMRVYQVLGVSMRVMQSSWGCLAGVSTQNGKIFPATFTDKGPYLVLRSTRIFTGAQQVRVRGMPGKQIHVSVLKLIFANASYA